MRAIYLLRRLMERYRKNQKDLYIVFIDREKMYNRVPRKGIIEGSKEEKGLYYLFSSS